MVEQAFLPVYGTDKNVCPTAINTILPLPKKILCEIRAIGG